METNDVKGYTCYVYRYNTNVIFGGCKNIEQYAPGEKPLFRSVRDVINHVKTNLISSYVDNSENGINHEYDDVDDIAEAYVYFEIYFAIGPEETNSGDVKVMKVIISPYHQEIHPSLPARVRR